jgi:hypothetical protein
VWVAVATPRRVVARIQRLQGSRDRIQRRGAAQALVLAWQALTG